MTLRQQDLQQIVTASLIGLTMLVFFPTVQNGFTNWDDGYHVVNNTDIRSLQWSSLRSFFTTFTVAHYIPLVSLSFALEYQFFGLDPFVFHFTNLLLHVIVTLLIYTLARKWHAGAPEAFVIALLFGIHPLHVEPVAWISARKDVLSGAFLLGSLLMFYTADEGGRRSRYLLSLLLYLFSLGSKSAGMFLPAFLLAQYYAEGRLDRKVFLRILPFGILAAGAAFLTLTAHDNAGVLQIGVRHSTAASFVIACYNILFYTVKSIVPFGLSAVYPFPDNSAETLPMHFYAAPLIVTAGMASLYIFRRSAASFIVPAAFFVIGLGPTLQLVPFGSMMAADRFAYLPSAGMLTILVLAAGRTIRRRPELRNVSIMLTAAVVMVFGWTTWNRVGVWHNSETLWSDAIRQYPDFPLSYFSRGQYYFTEGREGEASADFNTALRLAPQFPAALNMRGYMHAVRGNTEQARQDFERVIALQPENAMAYYNRGLLHMTTEAFDSAAADLSKAIEHDPEFTEALVQRGDVYQRMGRYHDAVADLTEALRLQPDRSDALMMRGSSRLSLEMLDEAVIDLRKAVALQPENAEGYRLLSSIYRKKGMTDSATYFFERTER